MSNARLGAFQAVCSSFFISTNNVISKYLLQYLPVPLLVGLWMGFASLVVLAAGLFTQKTKLLAEIRGSWRAGVIIGITNLVAAALFFTSIDVLGPSPTAFFTKFDVIFIVLFGFIFLKEKLSLLELLGILVAVAGAFIFAFSSKALTANAYLGVLASLAIGTNTLYARKYAGKVSVTALQLYRAVITSVAFLAFSLFTGIFALPALNVALLVMLGSVLSAVLGVGLLYASLKHLRASIASLVRNLDPLFVVVFAYFVFGEFPSLQEWIGGMVILSGVTLTLMSANINNIYKKLRLPMKNA